MIVDFPEIRKEILCLSKRRYPRFVFAHKPASLGDNLPVFTFHSIEPGIFQTQLEFLSVNGYRSLTADEFYDLSTGAATGDGRSVLLTMDDGRRSVWTFAYPLLKKYGFRATVFLAPGFVQEADGPRPNLEDYWAGRAAFEQLETDLTGGDCLVTWPEAERMHCDGVVDFQSHTMYHHNVFTGERIIGFHHPGNRAMRYDLALPLGFEERSRDGSKEALYGMPIYQNSPLMAGRERYLNDLSLTERCIDHVREHGGIEFFARARWSKELYRQVVAWQREGGEEGRFQSREEMEKAMLEDLTASRSMIQDRLSGKSVRHLCYPYGVGSEVSVHLSQTAGYVTNFWSIRPDRRTNRPPDDPFYCVRLKGDYIYRLPGRGRKSLLTILGTKARMRLAGALDYGGLPRP